MLYFDDKFYPVDQTMDGGDSTVRAGLLMMIGVSNLKFNVANYEVSDGYFCRHPFQDKWSNPLNWTNDQMLPYIAGLHKYELYLPIKRYFYKCLRRFGFNQNFQRDQRGSWKWPFPHCFFKDSNPIPDTFPMEFNWRRFKFEISQEIYDIAEIENRDGGPFVEIEYKMFDFADPILINKLGAIILAGRIWLFAPLLAIAYPVHILSLFIHSKKRYAEENQMIAECYLYGTLKLYKKWCKFWEGNSFHYWNTRNEVTYHHLLKDFIENETR